MTDFFWSTQNPSGQDVRCEGGDVVHVNPKSIGAIAGDAGNFVWKPGAVEQGNVYNNWPDLAAAIALVSGQKSVTVDTSLGAAHVVAGTYAGIVDVEFVAGGATGAVTVVHFDEGAHLTFPAASQTRMTFDGVNVDVQNTTAAVISLTGTQVLELFFRNAAILSCSGSKALVDFAGTSEMLCWAITDALIEGTASGTASPFNVSGGTPVLDFFAFDGSGIQSGVISASGGAGVVAFGIDGSSQSLVSTAQSIAPAVVVADPQPTFVFRPGGVAGGNVFTSWASLQAAIALTPSSPCTILFDDSLGALHITSGAWNVDQQTWTYAWKAFASGGTETVTIDVGATLVWNNLTIAGGLVVSCAATATVSSFAGATAFGLLTLREEAQLKCTSTGVFAATSGGGELFVYALQGLVSTPVIGDGTHNVFSAAVGSSIDLVSFGGTNVAAHAFGGAGTLFAFLDASAVLSATQDITTVTTTRTDLSSNVAYTAATGGNWNPNPTRVNAALDQLAASNTAIGTGNTGTGSGTVTVSTANITKAKNGKMLVTGSCACSTSAGATLTVTLKRDGTTTIGTAKTLVAAAAINAIDLTISATDTAPDNAAHTYQLSVAASAGNITVAANSAQVEVVEDS